MTNADKKIWMDGKFVNWNDATVHVLTHTLHYGLGVFEGIRCYKQSNGSSAIFRLKEHLIRLEESAKMFWMKISYSVEELIQVCKDTLVQNNLAEGYLRPLVFVGDGAMGLYAPNNPIRVSVSAWSWGAYLGDEGLTKGIRTKISSLNRLANNVNFSKAKACGNYINSLVAKKEAILGGYEEALLLDTDGYLAEGSGENIFVIKNGIVRTPPQSSSILNGITRDAVIELLKHEGIECREERITREASYVADEIFLTGTAAEITPVREVDDRTIGCGSAGPITKKIQDLFFKTVRGDGPKQFSSWLEPLK